jgi:hypothetical protein
MFRAKFTESSRTLLYSAAVLALGAVALFYGARSGSSTVHAKNAAVSNSITSSTFAGTGTGNIPDLPSGCEPSVGPPLNVTFNVTGMSGAVTNVAVSFTGAHTWVGDVSSTLIAPNGASHVIFSRTEATSSTALGGSDNLGGTYNFSDSFTSPPSGGWWQEALSSTSTDHTMTPGNYRTTQAGGAGATSPAPATNMNAAFAGVADANGTWTLRFTDGCNLDTGSVSAATLTLDTGSVGVVHDANTDFNGDGKTDYVVVRATTSPLTEATAPTLARRSFDPEVRLTPGHRAAKVDGSASAIAPPLFWYTAINGTSTTGVGQLGDFATDTILTEDFDGDGKDDPTVWTDGPATQANFKIFQSSTNTVRVEFFGQSGDDPAVIGDYDGDGTADPAVYRCPPASSGQCFYFFRGSLNNPNGNVTYVPWGSGIDGDFFPYVGDFDGDGKNDFCIQGADPSAPSQGLFYLAKSGGGVEYIYWGLSVDFLSPGDYDGDGRTDICVRRTINGQRFHFIAFRDGTTSSFIPWGISGDVSTPGDYDGDGKTDLAIWRQNDDPTQNFFWILKSTGGVTQFEWGQSGDFPVAGWPVH